MCKMYGHKISVSVSLSTRSSNSANVMLNVDFTETFMYWRSLQLVYNMPYMNSIEAFTWLLLKIVLASLSNNNGPEYIFWICRRGKLTIGEF